MYNIVSDIQIMNVETPECIYKKSSDNSSFTNDFFYIKKKKYNMYNISLKKKCVEMVRFYYIIVIWFNALNLKLVKLLLN